MNKSKTINMKPLDTTSKCVPMNSFSPGHAIIRNLKHSNIETEKIKNKQKVK